MLLTSNKDLSELRARILSQRASSKPCITVCGGTGCQAYGCKVVGATFKEELSEQGLENKIDFRMTGCHGFCERGPLVVIYPNKIFYQRVKTKDIKEIISETLINNKIVDRLLYSHPITLEKIIYEHDVPFYKSQERVLLGNNGLTDPNNIEDYIALNGYQAIAEVLYSMKQEDVIDVIKKSGLRGRGGAGFPTGQKWDVCRKAIGKTKYVICNGDEGDPGAYQDRSILEGDPHGVIEGMIIGAYAIGASKGYIYVRAEYPLAVKNLDIALTQSRNYGLLGKNILGSNFDFDIEVVRGAGAFVCGEETALLSSVEGKRGMPRSRPPYPAQSGLFGKPTNINNVKTWKSVPHIINRGAEWFSSIGTEKSKGTMVFSLVGKINNTGLVEVPMGISLKDLVYNIGGGIPNNKKLKAVQTGGPSGGCIPASLVDIKVDYEELSKVGSMMGSGGMIVMDEDTCVVDVAHYFLDFTQKESCGKCVPCRVGTRHMVEILKKITEGKGEMEDLEKLMGISKTVKAGSLCGLGQTAPNPILTTLRYFYDEYEAHIKERKCPALVCKSLISYYILPEKCVGCLLCLKNCPVKAITGELKKLHVIDQEICTKCGVCLDVCPKKINAVTKLTGEERVRN